MKSLNFRTKILLLSILPFVFISLFVIGFAAYQVNVLGEKNINEFSDKLFELRRKELKNYSDLAVSSVKHITQSQSSTDTVAIDQAKEILDNLAYGDDGYFFVYNTWINQILPLSQELQGTESDVDGIKVVESFYSKMIGGGGYTDYQGWRPTYGEFVDKIAYSDKLLGWDWWLGTGMYVDDLNQSINNVKNNVNDNIARTVKIIILVALVGVVLIGLFAFRMTFSEGKLADEKLQKLSLKNVVSQENERGKIARELHDQVTYKLIESKNKLRQVAESNIFDQVAGSPKQEFAHAVKNMLEAISDIRKISSDLRPVVLDKKGLEFAIEELVEKKRRLHSGVEISCLAKNIPVKLSSEIDICIYRILQEALANIYQHAEASSIKIRMVKQKNQIHLTIGDNGKGFDVKSITRKSSKTGVGLVDMRIRVESLGGSFSVYSTIGVGSHIIADIPLSG